MRYLLDTNVVSEAGKRRPDPNVAAWMATVAAEDLYLSVLVVGEIRQGVERLRRREAARAASYDAWLSALRRQFSSRIVPVTVEVAEEWGRLNVPDPVSTIDGLLAATAIVHGLTIVTRNTRDIARTGVDVLNPFVAG